MRRYMGYILFFLIVAVATFFRLYQLDAIPPGLWRDEAINGLDILNILKGHTPLLFGDREPLFIYSQAISVALFGPTSTALRLVSALYGIAVVAFTFVLVNRIFGRWTAVLASLGLATSFWHVDISRLGLRANTLPLFAMVSFYFLWVGIERSESPKTRRDSFWPFALSGLFLGVTLYTYLASRLVPLVFILLIVWLVACRVLPWRWGIVSLLTVSVFSLAVFSPLAIYYIGHPDVFIKHSADDAFLASKAGQANALTTLLGNVGSTLSMFTFSGDFNWRHNFAFRPVFDPISSVFFATGLFYSLYRIRRPKYALVALWLFVLLLPGMLSIDSPHFLRNIGAAPAAYILAAIGIVQVGRWLTPVVSRLRFSIAKANAIYSCAAVVLMAGVAYSTYHDYFESWATNPKVYNSYESDVADSARFLNTVRGEPLVMASAVYIPHPVTLFLARPFADLRWYDSSQALVIPTPDSGHQTVSGTVKAANPADGAIFIAVGSDNPALPLLQKAFPDGSVMASGKRPDGITSFSAFRVPDLAKIATALEPSKRLDVNLANSVDILGYDLQAGTTQGGVPAVKPGEILTLILYWKPRGPVSEPDLKFFTHLADSKLVNWGQLDSIGYFSSQWKGGELVVNRFQIKVAPNAKPGKYTLRFGMYAQSTMDRLRIIDNSGKPAGDAIAIAPIKVLSLDNKPPNPQQKVGVSFGGKAQLLGYDLPLGNGEAVSSGSKLRVGLYWRGQAVTKDDYTVFLHLAKPSGEVVAQVDGQPQDGSFPTSLWDEGEYVTDSKDLSIPSSQAPGDYDLIAGMYLLASGERLMTDIGTDSVKLGKITIK